VDFQAGFLHPFGALGGYGVGHAARAVAVARLADVESRLGVDLEPSPGFLQDLQDVPFGHALLDPAGEDLGGGLGFAAVRAQQDGLVGGDDRGHRLRGVVGCPADGCGPV
jgi:hypothetical protein